MELAEIRTPQQSFLGAGPVAERVTLRNDFSTGRIEWTKEICIT